MCGSEKNRFDRLLFLSSCCVWIDFHLHKWCYNSLPLTFKHLSYTANNCLMIYFLFNLWFCSVMCDSILTDYSQWFMYSSRTKICRILLIIILCNTTLTIIINTNDCILHYIDARNVQIFSMHFTIQNNN